MSEKIDLADIGRQLRNLPLSADAEALLALVRAVRAAKDFVEHQAWLLGYPKMQPLRDALAPFTDSNDSAEVRNEQVT